jgi:hypothetical protein
MFLEQSQNLTSQPHDTSHEPVPTTTYRPVGREHASWLLLHFYAPRYGNGICQETPASLRIKITQLKLTLNQTTQHNPTRHALTQQIGAYERISELLEMLPCR